MRKQTKEIRKLNVFPHLIHYELCRHREKEGEGERGMRENRSRRKNAQNRAS